MGATFIFEPGVSKEQFLTTIKEMGWKRHEHKDAEDSHYPITDGERFLWVAFAGDNVEFVARYQPQSPTVDGFLKLLAKRLRVEVQEKPQ